jgi:acyl-CoA reductase-like NAD-dependent aldehyde dehydrogenase
MKEETDMGPLNNEPSAKTVDRHIQNAREKGAKILTGGPTIDIEKVRRR